MVSPLSPMFGPFMCEQREVEKKRKTRLGWKLEEIEIERERGRERERERER